MFVGLRQAFVRFYGCSLSCDYCDSRETVYSTPPYDCRVERTPGSDDIFFIKNPVPLGRVLEILEGWIQDSPKAHHSISLTGGEPLLHLRVLKSWLPALKSLLPVFLETNGVLHEELSECIDLVDYISMDVKLPSTSGLQELWEDHLAFVRIASRRNLYVKAVVSTATTADEIRKTCELMLSVDRSIPLVLQPLTSSRGEVAISAKSLFEFQKIAAGMLREVRVIPQTHRFLGLL